LNGNGIQHVNIESAALDFLDFDLFSSRK